jgi:uncharacterized protein (TIGR03435 family)
VFVSIASAVDVFSQSPNATRHFEVVSIRRNMSEQNGGGPTGSTVEQRPDGSITLLNTSVAALIARAYPTSVPRETIKLPEWARRERYDVRATSSLTLATTDDRIAMLQALLADRFRLVVHFEPREQPAYDLVVARPASPLGPGLVQSNTQCPSDRGTANAPVANAVSKPSSVPQTTDLKSPPPPCALRIVGQSMVQRDQTGPGQGQAGDLLEGEATIATLADMLRVAVGRFVVDKTGLAGTYRVVMNFDMAATRIGPTIAPSRTNGGPSVFEAVERQLGLKLESSRVLGEALVIDRLERPTEN